jgi:RND family efflux transporter MFP subunit
MSDLKDDLAALRIERAPDRPGAGRWVGWTLLVVLLGAGGFGAWKWFMRDKPIEVQVATVTERAAGMQAAVLNASGYVTARRRATISSKVTGKVMEVNVEEGMAVKEGQVLARLDDTMPRATLALAEAQTESARQALHENEVRLAQARLTLGRLNDLLKDGIVTKADVDLAKTEVDATVAKIAALGQMTHVAERQVDVAKSDLDNMVIRAPFSGVAVTKDAQPGEMVSPVSAGGGFTRTGICTIVDMRSLEIDVDVNESYINRVKPGQQITAVLDAYPDWQIPGHVITVVPTADRQKATVQVRIAFESLDPRLLPDMGVKVTFLREAGGKDAPIAAQPTTLVPKASVVTESGQTYAYVVDGDHASRHAVRVGGTDGDRLEVLAGLRTGDRVILTPPNDIKDGAMITVK